jgi:ABC-type nitrate/sulfonate/bicarbonate transport system permease component
MSVVDLTAVSGPRSAIAGGAVPDDGPAPRSRLTWLPTVVLVVVILAGWELIARTFFDGLSVFPPPTRIIGNVFSQWSTFTVHIGATMRGALMGWVWGNGIAIVLAAVAVLIPFTEGWIMRVAIAISSLPVIALAPIFQVTMGGDAPKATLAALAVFFTTLVGALVGLRSADRRSLDLIAALGGGRWQQLRKVRLTAMLPSFFAALRISAPAAVLGSIIGEFLGRVEEGLGVALVNAQRNVQTDRVWAVAVIATAMAGAGYALIAAVGRLLTPWAGKASRS